MAFNVESYWVLTQVDMQHEICILTFHERLGFAPPCDEGAKVGRVLDLGTGTGLWAIDYGDQHPETEVRALDEESLPRRRYLTERQVLGVDLSPIQPREYVPFLQRGPIAY